MKRILLMICLCVGIVGCMHVQDEEAKSSKKNDEQVIEEDKIVDASFVAVGDNLVHGSIYLNNRSKDGSYSFENIFQNTNQYTQNADLAYINMETICAGRELGLSSYPKFNGPTEMIDAIADAGFDWLSGATNHAMDKGETGILREINYLQKNYANITLTGLHQSLDDANQYHVLDVNGIKVGVLNYTYGLNGNDMPQNKQYLVDLIDKEKIKKDVEAISQISDVQFVAMHWGVEYHFDITDTQKELAQYLSDLGVDVIIGTHPHVIQPVEYLTGANGNQTLVMYSLGNFLSAQDQSDCMLGGMMKWNIQYNQTKKTFSFENVQFLPTVTQIEENYSYFRTYALKDWTDELAKKHTLKQCGQNISRQYYIDKVNEIVGKNVEVVY